MVQKHSPYQVFLINNDTSAAILCIYPKVLNKVDSTRVYIDPFHGHNQPKEITAVSSPSLYNIIHKIRWVVAGHQAILILHFVS